MAQAAAASCSRGTLGSFGFFFSSSLPGFTLRGHAVGICCWALFHHSRFIFFFLFRADGQGSDQDRGLDIVQKR